MTIEIMKKNYMILPGIFKLPNGNKGEIKEKMEDK